MFLFAWQFKKTILFYFIQNSASEIQFSTSAHRPSFSIKLAIFKKTTNNEYCKDVEKKESSCTVGGSVNWCSHYGKNIERFLKNIKH